MTRKIGMGIGFAVLMIAAAGASLMGARWGNGPIPAPTPAPTILHCPYGNEETDCTPDFIGNGDWVLKQG